MKRRNPDQFSQPALPAAAGLSSRFPAAVLLSAVLLLAVLLLSACGSSPPAEESLIRVGFSQLGSESDWRLANTRSMTAALSEENGFELLLDNAKQRQENQLLAIRNFIQEKVTSTIRLTPMMT